MTHFMCPKYCIRSLTQRFKLKLSGSEKEDKRGRTRLLVVKIYIFREAKAWEKPVIAISLLYVEKVIFCSVKRS